MIVASVLGLVGPIPVFAATTPSLGDAITYGVLASTYTNSSAATTINGDVGFTTGPAVAPAGVHTNYGAGAPYTTAGTGQVSALADLNGQACTFTFAPGAINLSTDTTHGTAGTYAPGVYCSTGAMDIGGALTLSGSGTYIFRPVGAFTSTTGSVVTLTGASACDVFWTPTAATSLAASTTFFGTVIQPTSSAITVGADVTWTGRALAFGGTVTTGATDTITVPTCTNPATFHVVKTVVNDSGRTATASSFNVHVTLGGVEVSGSPAVGVVSPGRSYSLAAGTYVVSEDANASYTTTFSGACNSVGSATLVSGSDVTCTITNDDIAASSSGASLTTGTINVVKTVVNDNGRTKTVADFPLFINDKPVVSGVTNTFSFYSSGPYTVTETADPNYTRVFSGDCDQDGIVYLHANENKFCIVTNNDIGPPVTVAPVPPLIDVVKVPNPLALPSGPGPVTYTYTLRNMGTVPVSNVTMVGDTCSPIARISGDSNANGILEVNETWVHTCSTTLSSTHTNTVVATGWANGISATDIASATVVVGLPIVPPLIHVTKIPSPLALSAGGGMVTYTKRVSNPGTVPLSNVRLTDDKCGPVNYISGDTNRDSMLGTTETWVYTCKTKLTATTTNTVTASGDANGLTARDFAIATVVVAAVVPKFPSAGVYNTDSFLTLGIIALGISTALMLLYIVRKKQMV
ncbi:MAG: ice-binding family protein [bacterium]|nr:ice-binding family protein [bacterium]